MCTVGIALWICYGFMRQDWVLIGANVVTECFALPILVMKIYNKFWGNESEGYAQANG